MRFGLTLLGVVLLLLLPETAWAWGPAAHLEFGLAVLRDLALIAPAVAALLRRFPDDFLYGTAAADITVGKNFSPYHLHCHNWQVGLSVLDLARTDSTRAFGWGYLAHLAADVVAHNYYVPYKVVQHFERIRTPHLYWEMRYDTHMKREAWERLSKLSLGEYREHDRHLRRILTGPLFSFRVNKQIFRGMVMIQQLLGWQQMVKAGARRASPSLTREEVEEMRACSLSKVFDLLTYGRESHCLRADPIGHRNLLVARDLRRRLRQLKEEGRLIHADEIGLIFRPIFRLGMDHKLLLPDLSELTDPDVLAPVKRPRSSLTKRLVKRARRLRRRLFRRRKKRPE